MYHNSKNPQFPQYTYYAPSAPQDPSLYSQNYPLYPQDINQEINSVTRLDKFDVLVQKFEINPEFAIKLRQLEGYEIIIICDDSGSMGTMVTNPSVKDFKNLQSRWEELKQTVKIIIEIASCLDTNGVDLYFLNRNGKKNVSDVRDIDICFANEPQGYTPIVPVLSKILNGLGSITNEKKVLIIIATDGEPSTANGMTSDGNISEKTKLYNLLNSRDPIDKIYVSILACTDDDSVINYLQDWDTKIKNLDVVDDYNTVKNNVIKKYSNKKSFSFGDYVVKTLLGSIDKYFDEIDEISTNDKCCLIS